MTRPVTTPRRRRHRRVDDQGAVTLYVAIASIGLLVLIGLIADGGAKIRAIEHADTLAAEAARAAGQALDLPAVMAGRGVTVDTTTAQAAATAYLTANNATGTVTIGPAGRTITVRTTIQQPTAFLGLIGLTEFTVHGEATATVLTGPDGATP